ncbi:MAG: hypothetical protein WCY21_05945 [Candidatus Cloacimonadaceae bacterium]|jgi:tetratricopeptide (TPR) repeat protein|nr:hypothetical protein [Candidatus Cloacimonadota bacterium]MDX9950147.1 hypothetical protein [Candidatus Syntrophosphaera sp.]
MDTKTVFKLRKEGKIEEAYKLAKELHDAKPDDEWTNKAFFYTLYDKIKIEDKKRNNDALALLSHQVKKLKLPEDDEAINTCYAIIKRIMDPHYDKIQQAIELSKKGMYKKSVEIYRKYISNYKDDVNINENYGWDLYKLAKEVANEKPANYRESKFCLNYYLKLSNTRPSQLHSCMLQLAHQLYKNEKLNIVSFVKIWDMNLLQPEDYKQSEYEGKKYPGLAEKVYQAVFKELSRSSVREEIVYFDDFLKKAIDCFPDNIWLTYYKSKLLYTLQEYDEALQCIIKVLKVKLGEFWAWQHAGNILVKSGNYDLAVACYCKALICPVEKDKLLKIRCDLVPLLVKSGKLTEAAIEIRIIMESNNDRIIQEITHYLSEDWWKENNEKKDSNKEFYETQAEKASELLHNDLPWHKAVFARTFTPKQNNKILVKILVEIENGRLEETIAPVKSFPFLKNQPEGLPLKTKFFVDKDKLNILAIEQRNDGSKWDIIPSYFSMVDQINDKKTSVRCIAVNKDHLSYSKQIGQEHMLTAESIYSGEFQLPSQKELSKLKVGRPIEIRALLKKRENRTVLDIFTYKILEPDAIDFNLVKEFSGNIKIHYSGFGFVENVYVPTELIKNNQIKDHDLVRGEAIRQFVKRQNAWGWNCFNIEILED